MSVSLTLRPRSIKGTIDVVDANGRVVAVVSHTSKGEYHMNASYTYGIYSKDHLSPESALASLLEKLNA